MTLLMSLYHTIVLLKVRNKYWTETLKGRILCTLQEIERSHFWKFSFKGIISFHLRKLREQGSLYLFCQLLALCLKTSHPNLEFSFLSKMGDGGISAVAFSRIK